MPILEAAPAGPRREGVVWAPDVDDLIARHARDLADLADLLAMFHDEPRKGNAPSIVRAPRQKCGTLKAYKQHLYYGEPTCDKCRAANAAYVASTEKKRRNRSDVDVRQRAKCGTNKAYHQHRHYGEQTCDACKAAHSAAETRNAKDRRRRTQTNQAVTSGEAG